MGLTRQEHLEWAKDRALEYVRTGDVDEAFASFISDVGKHPEVDPRGAVRALGMSLKMGGLLKTVADVKSFIEGTN